MLRRFFSKKVDWRSAWIYGIVAVCLFFWMTTLLGTAPLHVSGLGLFNLSFENNLATLWSGMLLFLVALHMFDGWVLHHSTAPAVARAWLMLSLVLAALSFDEIGSLHERVPLIGQLSHWWSLLPFALIFGGMVAYALLEFHRSMNNRVTVRLVGLGFFLFAMVALQEHIEHRFDWPWYLAGARVAAEEGTELLAMVVLLKASMCNSYGILSGERFRDYPIMEAVSDCRRAILTIGFVGAPLLAYAMQFIPPGRSGQPADWPAAVLFVLAGLGAIRPFLVHGRGLKWTDWVVAGICIIGCASTITTPLVEPFPLMAKLAAMASLIWIVDDNYAPTLYLPAVVFLGIVLITASFFRENLFVAYCTVQYVALGFYYVHSVATFTADATRDKLFQQV